MPIPLPFCFSPFHHFLFSSLFFPALSFTGHGLSLGRGTGATSRGRSLQQGVDQASLWELEISCQILGELEQINPTSASAPWLQGSILGDFIPAGMG